MKIVYFSRRRSKNSYSVEKIFSSIRKYLPKNIKTEVFIPKYISHGFFSRLYDMFEVIFHQGDINHITGDIQFIATFLRKKKTVLTILDCVFLHQNLSKLAKFIIKIFWYEIPIRRVKMVTTISYASKKEIIKLTKCDPKKIIVIPACISDSFAPHKKRFNKQEPNILQIGTTPNKNLSRLFCALESINCHLTIIGHLSVKQVSLLKKYQLNYSNYYNLSEQEIINEYIKADIVTFVSVYEGFGLPIIEANAIGRPVITSNTLPMKDVAVDSACLVDPFDCDNINKGFKRIIEDKNYREKLVSNGFANIRRFDPKNIAKSYLRLYRKIIK
jgi:glycosyltransferase involved in cell wall biosynthesis